MSDLTAMKRKGRSPAEGLGLANKMAGIIPALLLVLLLGGCQAASRGPTPTPTRTPRPTYTRTPPATATPEPTLAPADTPEPTATPRPAASTPAPKATAAPAQAATPFLQSPFAGQVPKAGRAILIDQDQQQMYIFQDGVTIRVIAVSTGNPDGTGTRAWEGAVGEYVGKIYSYGTYADYAWYLFDDVGSILIHSVPYTLSSDGGKAYEDIESLGRIPVSHGCIRIPEDDARWFTFWEPQGVPIIITPWTGGSRAAG